MTELVRTYQSLLQNRTYRELRVAGGLDITELLKGLDEFDPTVYSIRLEAMLDHEIPVLFENDRFGFHRHQCALPRYVLENGYESNEKLCGNTSPNYARVLATGLACIRAELEELQAQATPEKARFYASVLQCVNSISKLAKRYELAARQHGLVALADALKRIPEKPAQTFYEACLFLHILLFSLRASGNTHITLGRFDQYMLPFFQRDLDSGITKESLLETLQLFFITLNIDSDLYFGLQQGDNGQSLVLGGFDKDGNDQFNALSHLCMEASLSLKLIDPKINLRCGKNTPQSIFEYATSMTKQGLGFPQYSNDDVVVPGLIALGYEPEDAFNYSIAACWEFIIPNKGFDIPNRATFNFPLVVSRAVHQVLPNAKSFDDVLEEVFCEIERECDFIIKRFQDFRYTPAPLLSLLTDGCLESGRDVSDYPTKYHNFGSHGAGISNAADALMAIKQCVFDEKSVAKEELLKALNANFEGYIPLRNQLLNAPKMGNNNDEVDTIASLLMEKFSSYLNRKPNGNGGIWRAGTGSALAYIQNAARCPATADGRYAFEPYGSSFSPAITTRLNGPLSVISSFTKFDMRKIINGGPLTMELHDTVFQNPEGEKKVAQLVRAYIELGGHQLQLNSINRDTLLDAQKHPEKYPNLIVRVWGWSGYFCELDPVYQNHIIDRTEFSV